MRGFLNRLKACIVRRDPAAGQADGQRAETHAAHYLAGQGLGIIARNHSVRGGEIDLICRHGESIVFVEVRMRRRSDYGGAAASITPAKRRRIILAARHWLAANPRHHDRPCRFDALLLAHASDERPEWIRNAFDAHGRV